MPDERFAESIHDVLSGSAVCFLGAGFSSLAKDSTGTQAVPSTSELTSELWTLAKTPPEPNATLADLADYFENEGRRDPLRQHLIKRLTLSNPSIEQRDILSLPWRAIFTTNFDDVPEQCIPATRVHIITPVTRPAFIHTDRVPLYYLHGRARDLIDHDEDPHLVLSETNYLDVRIRDSELYSTFVNEIHAATRLFFIGYSIKDTEVASRIISLGESLRQKSTVICRPTEGVVAVSRLQKFGAVLPIGVNGLDHAIKEVQKSPPTPINPTGLTFLRELTRIPSKHEVTKDDVDRLILAGEFDPSAFATQQRDTTDKSNIYCVPHTDKIDEIISSIDNYVHRFLITSDIGNGKSTFLKQLSHVAVDFGFAVYEIDVSLPEVFHDIDKVLATRRKTIFVVDDLIRHRPIATYIGQRLHAQAALVCATRDNYDSLSFHSATDLLAGAVKEIQLDRLTQKQLADWDTLLERWGYWESRITMSPEERARFLQQDCSAENRSIVISVFRTSYIANKVDQIVAFFVNRHPEHLRAFVAVLIASLCQKHVRWDQIVSWLNLDEDKFRLSVCSEDVFSFMSRGREWHLFTSTQLADHIFRSYQFDKTLLVDIYTTIVRETAYSSSDWRSGADSRENLKELMKFRFLSRLFGEGSDGTIAIEAVYSRLSKVPKIRTNDQFWLQYAMSCMEKRDLPNAETFIKTALGIAEKKGADYYDDQIVDQRSRLYFMKNSQSGRKVDEDEISVAVTDLMSALNDNEALMIYPMRSATYILEFIDEKIDDMSADLRGRLLELLDRMKEVLSEHRELPKSQRGETRKLTDEVRKARLVLQNA